MNSNQRKKDDMKPLTTLKTVPESLRKELHLRGINSCEQLFSLLMLRSAQICQNSDPLISFASKSQWHSIREELDEVLPEEQRAELIDTFDCEQKTDRPMGALPPWERPDAPREADGERPLIQPQSSPDDKDQPDDVSLNTESDPNQEGGDIER